eukprot:c4705_g1_i1.p1 GENE.c4705_g1_i1~~c4705_g1_i1.p1  ORF type:complete len:499 (-),score=76.38 c4705_g1_i1:854-2350(-)
MNTLSVVGLMLLSFIGVLIVLLLLAYVYEFTNRLWGDGSFSVQAKLQSIAAEFTPLKKAPRELWIVYVLKFLESYGYFSMSLILTLYLSEEFGYSDTDAGLIYGMFGMLVSVYGICIGFVIDNFGVQKSMVLGHTLLVIGRFGLALSRSRFVMMVMLFVILPIGESLGIPVMMTGIRRYTDSTNRTAAFGLFYQVMNVAALVAGPAVDTLREVIPKQPGEDHLSAYRVVIFSGAASTLIGLVIVTLFVREVEASEEGKVSEFKPKQGSPLQIAREIMAEDRFWRFLLFVALLIGVKMVFRHLDATFPKWMTRSFGEDSPFGSIYAINPFLIIILVPIVSAYTKKINPLPVITVGAWISSLSLFVLVWQDMAAAIIFVVVLSVGEAIWSPRLYEYTTIIAPKGREGTYASLSSAPYFVAKLGVGYSGGYLLEEYCSAYPCSQGWIMWLIIGITTIIGPIGIVVFYSYIGGGVRHEDEEEDEDKDPLLKKEAEKPSTTAV